MVSAAKKSFVQVFEECLAQANESLGAASYLDDSSYLDDYDTIEDYSHMEDDDDFIDDSFLEDESDEAREEHYISW